MHTPPQIFVPKDTQGVCTEGTHCSPSSTLRKCRAFNLIGRKAGHLGIRHLHCVFKELSLSKLNTSLEPSEV